MNPLIRLLLLYSVAATSTILGVALYMPRGALVPTTVAAIAGLIVIGTTAIIKAGNGDEQP